MQSKVQASEMTVERKFAILFAAKTPACRRIMLRV
jgi:hypothetical protein